MELVLLRGAPKTLGRLAKDIRRPLMEEEAIVIFRELIRGVEYMHQVLASHRDIKLDNALVNDVGKVKLCDFGLSKIAGEDSMMKSSVGTITYLSPEVGAVS